MPRSGPWCPRDVAKSASGASAVEFAVVLPLLLLFLLGIIEFGLAFNRSQAFEAAAHEAGRLASIGVEVDDEEADAEVSARIKGIAASTVSSSRVVVESTGCASDPDDDFATVRVTVGLDAVGQEAYRIRIPVPGNFFERSLDYEAEAVFRCEVEP